MCAGLSRKRNGDAFTKLPVLRHFEDSISMLSARRLLDFLNSCTGNDYDFMGNRILKRS